MAVSETQFRVWRGNLQSNFGAALRSIVSEEDPEKAKIIASMNESMSRIYLAERISQLSQSLTDEASLLSEMVDRDVRGRDVVERLVRTIREDGPDKEMAIAMAEDWAEGTFQGIFGLEEAELIPEGEDEADEEPHPDDPVEDDPRDDGQAPIG